MAHAKREKRGRERAELAGQVSETEGGSSGWEQGL